jgi:hypothetical protein
LTQGDASENIGDMVKGASGKGGGGNAHDRAVAAAAAKKLPKPLRPVETSPSETEYRPSSVRSYLRGIGAASVLLGAIGVLQTFYLPSVIAVYSGLLLLVVDAVLERLIPFFKIVVILILISLGVAFTHFVVLWEDPLTIIYQTGKDGTVYVSLFNKTSDDFRSVDLHFSMPSQIFVVNTTQMSQMSSCSLLVLPYADALFGDESFNFKADSGQELNYGNYERVRCEVLPHESGMQFSILLRQGRGLSSLSSPLSGITVRGNYQGKFRAYSAPKTATAASDTYSWGWSAPIYKQRLQ